VADVSSTESLQLSDVILALSESQQLLLTKVRTVLQESGSPSVLDASTRVDVVRQLDLRTPERETIEIADDQHEALLADERQDAIDSVVTPGPPSGHQTQPETITLSSHENIASGDAAGRGESQDRDYNFFDELDAKLARMEHLGGGKA
jgi:hypothetical protein